MTVKPVFGGRWVVDPRQVARATLLNQIAQANPGTDVGAQCASTQHLELSTSARRS